MVREVRKLNPDLSVDLLSGYASQLQVYGKGLRAEDIQLMKPVSKVELLSVVERGLAQWRGESGS